MEEVICYLGQGWKLMLNQPDLIQIDLSNFWRHYQTFPPLWDFLLQWHSPLILLTFLQFLHQVHTLCIFHFFLHFSAPTLASLSVPCSTSLLSSHSGLLIRNPRKLILKQFLCLCSNLFLMTGMIILQEIGSVTPYHWKEYNPNVSAWPKAPSQPPASHLQTTPSPSTPVS